MAWEVEPYIVWPWIHSALQSIFAGTGAGIWKYTLVSGPEDYSLSINDGAIFTNQTTVTLTLTAPAGTSEVMLSNDGGFIGASWEPFEAEKPWEIIAYGDYVLPKIVYAKFKTYGNVSSLYQDDIILDTITPTGTIEITSPVHLSKASQLSSAATHIIYLPMVSKNARPGFTLARLLLSATDDFSGVDSMLISNCADFSVAQWDPFTVTKGWWIPDSGEQKVYVQYQDRAGNISATYSDTFLP